jgi:hypothetical protein
MNVNLWKRCALGVGCFLALGCAQAQDAAHDTENQTARWQITYNGQMHPSFGAAYTGPNSLVPGHERMYTLSATAFLGWRPWQGGELYFNPEMAEGVPFSTNLVGLGGFTNGEITRAAGEAPVFYRQRLFLRQTWNQGGGTEAVESALNQMAGTVDKNRWVLTLGNFSTLDVFDPNTYAKDPRTQFMNWGNWTYAAYDYAADARGFGWGFAAEWYHDDWVLRFGRMSGPKAPNLLEVDLALARHFGDQVEVEHAHTLGGQPGKVRLLGWRNRAQLANFDDALAWLQAHPGHYTDPTALFQVRAGDQWKYGVGLNLEQALSAHTGLFLRLMQADGHTETHAFTEVDGSFSSGLLIKGAAWGREQDSVGVSLMANTLSDARRHFLEAGGTSFFIGDGALRYRPETIFEGYYSWEALKRLWLSLDVQHIQNPAYNADRGPMTVYALRIHTER